MPHNLNEFNLRLLSYVKKTLPLVYVGGSCEGVVVQERPESPQDHQCSQYPPGNVPISNW